MKTHENAFRYGKDPIHWREDGTCSYCGSITTAEAVRLLQTQGTHYSGSDWKYGWPHKFYIDNKQVNPRAIKFYSEHLVDASPEEFAAFSELSDRLFGVGWSLENDKLMFNAVPGIQLWGVIP